MQLEYIFLSFSVICWSIELRLGSGYALALYRSTSCGACVRMKGGILFWSFLRHSLSM